MSWVRVRVGRCGFVVEWEVEVERSEEAGSRYGSQAVGCTKGQDCSGRGSFAGRTGSICCGVVAAAS